MNNKKKSIKSWILHNFSGPSGKGTYVLTLTLPKKFRAKCDKFTGEVTVYEKSEHKKVLERLEKIKQRKGDN